MSVESLEFKAEMTRMMDIIIHSLYSNQEIFLRELISNSCDAIDKVRFESITNQDILEENSDWKIKLIADEKENTLTISDNGVGMNYDSIIQNLGTIAKSGTKEFVDQLQKAEAKDRPELIGQFGLGFYASFMVADKVSVLSRMAGNADEAVRWESDGKGEFTVEKTSKESRGTDITLHLKEDAKEYLSQWKLRDSVTTFSDFIEHPVVMDVERTESEGEGDDKKEKTIVEEETLNSQQAIWQKGKSDISEEEHKKFYAHISKDYNDYATEIHYVAEGVVEFKSLLYLPKARPFDFLNPEKKHGLHLYIKRVFIMDDCKDLLPSYLRFIHGVVDAADLPLNVSRELLQKNPMLANINKNLTSKILSSMKSLMKDNYDIYLEFYKAFGTVLKEGVHTDFANKEKISKLMLFESSDKKAGEYTSLEDYVKNMAERQEEIYYLIGESRKVMEQSPYLEAAKANGYNVLFMNDPIDEWVVSAVTEFDGKKLKAVDKGDFKEDEGEQELKKVKDEQFKDLLTSLNDKIKEVKEVRLSSRLKESASCLVAEEGEMSSYMENIMKKISPDGNFEEAQRILELNSEHSVVKKLQEIFEKDSNDARLEDFGYLLYDQAVLTEGSKVSDPMATAKRINKIIMQNK